MNAFKNTNAGYSFPQSRLRSGERRSSLIGFLGVLAAVLAATGSHAATLATGSLTDSALGGGLFDYTITLKNTGTTSIETFWYAWVPGEDYLATIPTNIVSPAGWTKTITGGGPGDGYAIEWTTSTTPLTVGSSFNFTFRSTDTPAEIGGDSVFFPGTPVGTSFVYQGAAFSIGSDQFVVASVPEPSILSSLGLGLLAMGGWRGLARRRGLKLGQIVLPLENQ